MNYTYTLDGAYIGRELALRAMRARTIPWCSLPGESRTYLTTLGKLTVWVWPFRI